MKNADPMTRLLIVISAMGFNEKELDYLERQLLRLSPGDLDRARREISRHDFNFREKPRQRNISLPVDRSIGDRVERLLKIEAKLSTAVAVDLVATELISQHLIAPNEIPPLSKKSLADWANRITAKVSARDLLRTATLIRNSVIHRTEPDWSSSST